MGVLLLIVVLVLLVGGLPQLGYHAYGYAPSGVAIVLAVVVLVLLLSGRL